MKNAYDQLSFQDRVFVDTYVIKLHTGDAAEAAGISLGTAYKRLSAPGVRTAISTAMDEKSRLSRIDASWVLKRVALMADFSIKNFIVVAPDDGRLYYDFNLATDDDWYCINEITVGAVRAQVAAGAKLYVDQVKIKTIDRLKALEMVRALVGDRATVDQHVTEVVRRVVSPSG